MQTVNVSAVIYDQSGVPVALAAVGAELDRVDVAADAGYVVPKLTEATADENGLAVMALWPNALGATESRYRFRAYHDGKKILDIWATIPNEDCNLWVVAYLPDYESKTAEELAYEAEAHGAQINEASTPLAKVNVSVTIYEQDGSKVAGAKVFSRLDRLEIDPATGYVSPNTAEAVTNTNGLAVIKVWPNALGSTESKYRFWAHHPTTNRKLLDVEATIPNEDCNLRTVAYLPHYEGKTEGENAADLAVSSAQEAAASATKSYKWAEHPEDLEVENGKYSAKHHRMKAAASAYVATGAADHAEDMAGLTEADRIQTGLDVVSAEAARNKSQDWAESEIAPGGVGTKSSKSHAADAQAAKDLAEAAAANLPSVAGNPDKFLQANSTGDGWLAQTAEEHKQALGLETSIQPTVSSQFSRNKHSLYEKWGLTDKTIDGIWDTTADAQTYIDAVGGLQTSSVGEPVVEFDPATGENLGLRVQEQRTNLVLNSDSLSTQNVTVAAVAHTLHFTGTGTIGLSGAHSNTLVGTGVGEANRVSLTFTPSVGTLTLTVTGDVLKAQLEAGIFPTSYIPTTASQVTRAADQVERTLAAGEFNPEEGTVICEVDFLNGSGIDQRMATLYGDGNNRFFFNKTVTDNFNFVIRVAGDTATRTVNIKAGLAAGERIRGVLAYKYGPGVRPSAFYEGVKFIVGVGNTGGLETVTATLTPMSFGSFFTTGHMQRLEYIPRALTDDELIRITRG